VFKSRVLRRIFRPKRDEVRVEWRKVHNEELRDLFCSASIVQVIKWRRIRWVGHTARVGERRGVYKGFVGNVRERDHLGDPGVDGRIILIWIFRKLNVEVSEISLPNLDFAVSILPLITLCHTCIILCESTVYCAVLSLLICRVSDPRQPFSSAVSLCTLLLPHADFEWRGIAV
jgi:hypothetical protein